MTDHYTVALISGIDAIEEPSQMIGSVNILRQGTAQLWVGTVEGLARCQIESL